LYPQRTWKSRLDLKKCAVVLPALLWDKGLEH
jgi:hypothetical protein